MLWSIQYLLICLLIAINFRIQNYDWVKKKSLLAFLWATCYARTNVPTFIHTFCLIAAFCVIFFFLFNFRYLSWVDSVHRPPSNVNLEKSLENSNLNWPEPGKYFLKYGFEKNNKIKFLSKLSFPVLIKSWKMVELMKNICKNLISCAHKIIHFLHKK